MLYVVKISGKYISNKFLMDPFTDDLQMAMVYPERSLAEKEVAYYKMMGIFTYEIKKVKISKWE